MNLYLKDPKISIITCVYNSSEFLHECLMSVKSQKYKNIEHLFIDGGSRDDTIEIIRSFYESPIIIKQEGKGLYDAINHGLAAATGNVIGFLHSDDLFYDESAVSRIASSYEDIEGLDYYCSKMVIFDNNSGQEYAILGAAPHKQTFNEQLYSSTYYAHPTYYCTRETINRVGYYNTGYEIASDIDWLIRLEKLNLKFYFDKTPLVKLRNTGKSGTRYFLAICEEFQVRAKHEGISFSLLLIYFYHFSRRTVSYILTWLKLNFLVF